MESICSEENTETKESMIEYYKMLHPNEYISPNISYDELYFKLHGQTHDQCIQNTEETNKKVDQINYENIPQRKMVLKKKNIKFVKGVFFQELNKFQTILQSKKGKRIIILNFYVDGFDIYTLINEYGIKIRREKHENISVSFSIKIPVHFEIIYFSLKVNGFSCLTTNSQPQLKIFKEIKTIVDNITPRLIEITPKIGKALTER